MIYLFSIKIESVPTDSNILYGDYFYDNGSIKVYDGYGIFDISLKNNNIIIDNYKHNYHHKISENTKIYLNDDFLYGNGNKDMILCNHIDNTILEKIICNI